MLNSSVIGYDVEIENNQHRSFSQEQIEIIRKSIAPTLTEDEFKYFLYICTRFSLDPIARQIYPLKIFDKKSNTERMLPFVSIDGLRLLADRTNKYSPGKPTEFVYSEKGEVISATSYVKKLVGGEWHDVSSVAVYSEYSTGKWPWTNKPHIMLEKCAEAKAIRRAFPSDTSGLYVQEEEACIKNENISSQGPQLISSDKAKEIQNYFSKRPELGKQLLSFCSVKSFSEITVNQLPACEKFIVSKMKEAKEEKNENS